MMPNLIVLGILANHLLAELELPIERFLERLQNIATELPKDQDSLTIPFKNKPDRVIGRIQLRTERSQLKGSLAQLILVQDSTEVREGIDD
jgi:hypothetical protein